MLLRRYASALWYLIPLLVLSMIWVPEFSHYYEPHVRITDRAIQHFRAYPSDSVLDEMAPMGWGMLLGFRNERELIFTAERILNGELKLPYYPASRISLPFDANDLTTVATPLEFAGLIVPDLLLDAYRLTGREQFFVAARDIVIELARYERTAWLPKGFLWNDHAIWARVSVLTRFWRVYRTRPDFNRSVAEAVLELLTRSGQLLARPSHFFARTNHGVMQNMGLLELCIAFPELVENSEWCNTAIDRLRDQMSYYVNAEGIVLEHSAGYHALGMEFLGTVLRYLKLLGRPIPPEWADKYRKARAYYADLRRPDGTLPMYGDTPSIPNGVPLVATGDTTGNMGALQPIQDLRPTDSFNVFPVAGNAVWWRGLDKWPDSSELAQTVVTWANFPSRAHKIADDMSIVLWSGGQTWVTNTGSWPYEHWGREQSEGWQAANGPHLLGERKDSDRTTELLSYGDNGLVTVLDLRRSGPAGYSARRQIVQLGTEFWLVLDQVQDETPRRSATTWTVYPTLAATEGPPTNAFRLISPDNGPTMLAYFLGSSGTEIRTLRGSRQPFGGWVVTENEPRPASAFMVEQPSQNSWAAALWVPEKRGDTGAVSAPMEMLEWTNAERWLLKIALRRSNIVLQRVDDKFYVRGGATGRDTARLGLVRGPDILAQRTAIGSAFKATMSKYPKWRDLYEYRLKITYLLAAMLAIQEILRFLLRKVIGRYSLVLSAGLGVAWLGIGAWVVLVYLVP